MYSVPGDTTSLAPGFPIRTSSDPRSVDSSPRHIAASHVLHRLPVPRHPPCALTHLHTKLFFTKRNCITTHQTHQPPKGAGTPDARCSQPLSTNQTPHPTTKTWGDNQIPISGFPHSGRRDSGPVASKPNSVSGNPSPVFPHRLNVCRAPTGHPLQGPALISQPRTPHTCEARGNENGAP
jgi:hypothetical protein